MTLAEVNQIMEDYGPGVPAPSGPHYPAASFFWYWGDDKYSLWVMCDADGANLVKEKYLDRTDQESFWQRLRRRLGL
jgi:hypothetical protein